MSPYHTPRYFRGEVVHSTTLTAHPANNFGELIRSIKDTPQVLPVTYESFHKLPKPTQSKIKRTLNYLTPCTFPESSWTGGRTNENARVCNLIFIDIDDLQDAARLAQSPALLKQALSGLAFFAYRTTSSTPENPRMRVIVEAEGIQPDHYPRAARTIAKMLGLKHLTAESEIPCQPMFVPSIFKGQDMDWDDPRIADRIDGRPFTETDIVESPSLPSTSAPSSTDSDRDDGAGLEFLRSPVEGFTVEKINVLLSELNADMPRIEWLKVAAALKHQFIDDPEQGYELFEEWSCKAKEKYDGADSTRRLWDSLEAQPKNKVPSTLHTIINMVKKLGGTPDRPANSQARAKDEGDLLMQLDKRRLHLSKPPLKPVTVYSLAGQQISTAGNLTIISAQAKAGKTAVMGAMNASVLGAENEAKGDFLGFTAAPHSGKAVIYFDTEQAPYDAWKLLERAAIRAACESWPENFRLYSLADIGTPERRKMIKLELERSEEQCGGIHSVFVDGVADLCLDPNDAEESFGLVEELQHLAIKHHCPLITVLHENPSGAETGKTRGHLGSQLERKAESNLRVVKDSKGICTIYSERCRRASIPKEHGPNFTFDAKAGMHLSYKGDLRAERLAEKRRIQEQLVNKIFQVAPKEGFLFEDLKSSLMLTDSAIKDRTARRRINEWKTLFLVHVCPAGKYQRSQSEGETPRESGSITP